MRQLDCPASLAYFFSTPIYICHFPASALGRLRRKPPPRARRLRHARRRARLRSRAAASMAIGAAARRSSALPRHTFGHFHFVYFLAASFAAIEHGHTPSMPPPRSGLIINAPPISRHHEYRYRLDQPRHHHGHSSSLIELRHHFPSRRAL